VAAGGHDLALETAADDRAAQDHDLGLVLGQGGQAGGGGIVGDRGRVLDHVRDVPVDAADAAAVPGAVDADQVLEPRTGLGVIGDHRERMPEVGGVVHRGLEGSDDGDVDELAGHADARVVAAADDHRVVPGRLEPADLVPDRQLHEVHRVVVVDVDRGTVEVDDVD
jgi:hypothetical protein